MTTRISWSAFVIVVAGLATPPPTYAQIYGNFQVDGDVVRPMEDVDWISLAANSPDDPSAPQPGDRCHFDLELRAGGAAVRLTAILAGGLPAVFMETAEEVPRYVGRAELSRMPWQDESRSPGTFFASLDLGPSEERMTDTRTIPASGTFRSSGLGRVRIQHFDGSVLSLMFSMPMIENIGERYDPRRVVVAGLLRLQFGQGGPFGDIFQLWGIVPEPLPFDPGAAMTIYRCGNHDEVKQAAEDAANSPN